jgi:hypothetical protein
VGHHQADRPTRRDPRALANLVTDSWTIWTRDGWERYEVTYDPTKGTGEGGAPGADDDIKLVDQGAVATKGHVPFVCVELPDELWAMNIIATRSSNRRGRETRFRGRCSAAAFRPASSTSRRTPGDDGRIRAGGRRPEGRRRVRHGPRPAGEGRLGRAPAEAFEPIADYAKDLKDEIYRVAHQMALGVENNAAAIGRSAESKNADDAATVVVVRALAKKVRETLKRVLELVALGRGEKIEWTVGGMAVGDEEDDVTLTNDAVALDQMPYGKTWKKAFRARVALAKYPDATPEERDAIRAEIAKIVDAEPEEPVEPKERRLRRRRRPCRRERTHTRSLRAAAE